MADRFPGWVATEAHLEYAVLEEMARLAAETAVLAADVPPAIFRAFGQKLIDLAPIDGETAGALVTVTAIDSAGYTLPAGFPIGYRVAGDELRLFETTAEAVIPAGATQLANVAVASQEPGVLYNGVTSGSTFEPIEAISWLSSIVSTTASSGGVDPETDDEYLDRLADQLTLISPRPILAADFAVLARNVEGVTRAVAVDGFNPTVPSYNNERMVAVAAVDSTGSAVSAAVRDAVRTYLDEQREINFVVHTFDPTYTNIAVVFTAQATADAVAADVEAAAEAAVADYLDPAKWGGGGEQPPAWRLETTVRYTDVVALVEAVPGVDFITRTLGDLDLTLNGTRTDVVLAGDAPLPQRVQAGGSTVAGTVVAP